MAHQASGAAACLLGSMSVLWPAFGAEHGRGETARASPISRDTGSPAFAGDDTLENQTLKTEHWIATQTCNNLPRCIERKRSQPRNDTCI